MAEETQQALKWEASEYIHHEKSPQWMLAYFGVVALILGLTYLMIKDVVSVIVIALLATAVFVLANRKPKTLSYELTDTGITINGREYPYNSFRSFSVVQYDAVESLFLEPMQRYMPSLSIYVAPDQIDDVANVISQYIPNRIREPDLIDQVIHRLRL